ncbi:MAG TPA: PilZ domain-containing protein, partial [Chromatiales bacterium]|nr:PilZ domain-containing protein [Chromatiales bacterium]
MRQFVRHPSNIPIHVEAGEVCCADRLTDIGFGGLRFNSHTPLAKGCMVTIRIDVVKPPFEIMARVVWNRQRNDGYETGVEFVAEQDAYKARMVEQICHIEDYRQRVREEEGRHLSSGQAALEWIERYAASFPGTEPDPR